MANTKVADGGPARMTWLWMGVGIVTTVLFFWWISTNSEPSQVVVPEEDLAAAEESARDASTARTVALAEILAAPADFVAQEVHVPEATITSLLGDNAFWVESASGPFLVVKHEDFTTTGGAAVQAGAEVSLTGLFWEQSSATIEQWRETGFMTDAGHLLQAEFATHYIQAREVGPAEAGTAAPGQ
jgi:hypothetical protein